MIKRRLGECGKRRPSKRSKLTEGICSRLFVASSSVLYLRFFIVWAVVILADFMLEFRFEYLWPLWLSIRSVYDSFKFQGLAFSMFFALIALSSDLICFFFIPIHWLFFAASTYVWVQYVWHTDRGICLPTVSLWLLFVYIEASVRLKELKTPYNLDLCRPFAAHCIGYPVVTLGFGFKSYVSYRLRLRKQREVARENQFYKQLLEQALPQESLVTLTSDTNCVNSDSTSSSISNHISSFIGNSSTVITNGVPVNVSNGHHNQSQLLISSGNCATLSSSSSASLSSKTNNVITTSSVGHNHHLDSPSSTNLASSVSSSSVTTTPSSSNNSTSTSGRRQRNSERNNSVKDSNLLTNNLLNGNNSNKSSVKDDVVIKLEGEIKKLRNDLHNSKQVESELRTKLNLATTGDKDLRADLHILTCNNEELQQEKENLQSKVNNLLSAMQQEKQCISVLKKEIQEEKKVKASLELQLNNERKVRQKAERTAALSSSSSSPDHQNDTPSTVASSKSSSCRSSNSPYTNSSSCTNGTSDCTSDPCKSKRKELECEVNNLRRQIELREEHLRQFEREVQTLRQYKDTHSDTQYLKSAFSAMQEKTQHLENSLSAETRLKLDLFSALGDAKRQLEITHALLSKKDKEIDELRCKIAEVMAVMPSTSTAYSPMVESSLVSSILFNSNNCKYIHSDAASNSMNNSASNGSHRESALSKVLCDAANASSLYSPQVVPSDL